MSLFAALTYLFAFPWYERHAPAASVRFAVGLLLPIFFAELPSLVLSPVPVV
jgi:hypothetical protein